MAFLVLLFLVVHRLTIHLDETVEFDHLALGNELFRCAANADIDSGLLHLGIGHLAGDGTFPNQFVQFLLLSRSLDGRVLHIGRADGLVSLLGTFRTGMILAYLAVWLAIEFLDFLLAGIDAQAGEVDRVGTHVGDLSVLVQVLGNHHRLANREA